jgi:ssDNA-binding Zn-finger/Zn-ribbon topoisomerase 1
MAKTTNNGKKGGLLKGKPHYDKNGKSLGGIKAIVTDTNQIVELEGGEVIINKEASKKHWKELSRINQSAGDGVPILPPDEVLADADEYKEGGNLIQFNPNKMPSKWVHSYAKKIKENYPAIWDLGGNIYGNEAYNNLERVINRGHWLESEEWFFVKWQSFNARHSGDFLIAGVIANLKWLNVVDKGWDYMKDIIEAEIKKRKLKKMKTGGEVGKYDQLIKDLDKKELKMGVHAEQEHSETYQKIYDHEITPEEAPLYVAVDHLKEMDDYYSRLAQMEGMKDGGKIAQVMREFKEGDLKSSSGEKVTDVKQAIAIGLSEQRRHEAEKKFGGVVRCSKCSHSWHRVDNHTTDVNVCHKCGQDNSKHVKLFEEGGYVEIEKTDKMKSNIFFNTDILKSNGDYILGGFNANDLNYIDVDGDSSLLSMPKLKLIFKKRLKTAIDQFKKEIRANVISRSNEAVEKYYVEEVVENEIINLLETYLGVTTIDFDTEDLVHLIQNDGSYETWVERVRTRMVANRKRIDFSNENINKVGGIDIEEAEDNTYNATLEQMLEQLKNITEENTI